MARGMLLVLSGPSGVGKGALRARLLADDPSFFFSVSATTRAPRVGETPDVDYTFITEEAFDALVREDGFLEHATVHGHQYGTLRSQVESKLAQGTHVLLEIDTQGARSVLTAMTDCVSVFILPPSYEELARRLVTRNTDAQEVITRRLRNARGEIADMRKYRYILVNDRLDEAYATLKAIVLAEKHNALRYHPEVPEGGSTQCP